MRDEFPNNIKQQLSKRVGYRCSNPDCRQLTSGPSLSGPDAVNMGVAAHITAASAGGARYDPSLSPEQRKSYENGIWLCKYCGDLVDKDATTYPVDVLRAWKTLAEQRAGVELHRLPRAESDERSQTEQQENVLENWIKDGRTRWGELVAKDLSREKPFRFTHGVWTVAYSLIGKFKPIDHSGLKTLLKQTQNARIGSSGWPVWSVSDDYSDLDVYPYHELLECWMGNKPDMDAAHSVFWRASSNGLMYLTRGYEEDCAPEKVETGSALWFCTPMWDVSEVLLHAKRLSIALEDEDSSVLVTFLWEGLENRTLRRKAAKKGGLTWFDRTGRTCRQPSVASPYKRISTADIPKDVPTIVHEVTKPLYKAFNLYEPSIDDVRQEVSKLMKNNF